MGAADVIGIVLMLGTPVIAMGLTGAACWGIGTWRLRRQRRADEWARHYADSGSR
jgi:hypothetical protein